MDRPSRELGVVTAFPRSYADNEALIDGVNRRDSEALQALYRRFRPRVHRFVWRLMGIDQEHDDVVQDTFINIISSMGGVKDPAALEYWVSGVAINTARREIRKRKLLRLFHLVPEVPEEDHPCDEADKALIARRFYAVIDGLGVDDRVVLVLRLVEGLELKAIAQVTGWSLATVKRRIERAKDVFRKRARRDPVLASILEDDADG